MVRFGISILLLVVTFHGAVRAAATGAEFFLTAHDVPLMEVSGGLRSPDPAIRRAALYRLGSHKGNAAERLALDLLRDPVWSVRRQACRTLEVIGTDESRPALETLSLGADSPQVRSRAVIALGRIADARSLPVVVQLLGDADFGVRGSAAQQAAAFRDTILIEKLSVLASDPCEYVRIRAQGSLAKLDSSFSTSVPSEAMEPREEPETSDWLPTIILFCTTTMIFLIAARRRRRAAIAGCVAGAIIGLIVVWYHSTGRDTLRIVFEPELAAHPLVTQIGLENFIAAIRQDLAECDLGINADIVIGEVPEIRQGFNASRNQYDMRRILPELKKRPVVTVAVTNKHLYMEPFYSILGHADPRAGLVSTRVIDPLHLGEDATFSAAETFRKRISIVLVHEMGHARRLAHCGQRGCVMRSVEEAAEEFYGLETRLCGRCESLLQGRKSPKI